MVKKSIRDIQDNEILAKPIMTWDYQIILPQGASLKKDYIKRLEELGISEVYVKENEAKMKKLVILKSDVENSVRDKVKNILERHTYHHNKELVELSKTADNIISTIVEEEQVVERIYDIKERSTDIYEHSVSICSLAILTALKLNVDKQNIHDIGVGCLLHDIGLRYSTIDFIHRDVNDLNVKELIEYKKHPIYGYSSVQEEEWISKLSKAIILHHHERLDGSGFPLHVREDIPYECKIVSVSDAFDEMICGITTNQVKVYEAIEYLKAYKNTKFDGRIVDTFIGFTALYPAGSRVITSEGEMAIVVSQNKEFHDRPVIRIIKDKYGNDVKTEIFKDLMKMHNIFIDKVVD